MILVSYSEIATARQCPHKHVLSYQERWVGIPRSAALARGTLWHLMLERWYLALREDDAETGHREVGEILGSIDDPEEADLLAWMWNGYLEQYGIDPDWKVIAVEHACQVPLPTPTGHQSRFTLKVKVDLIVEEIRTGSLYIVDHKTAKNMPNNLELAIDDQHGLYIWAMRKAGVPIFGSYHSVARTHRNKTKPQDLEDRFSRTRLWRNPTELDTIAIEAYKTMKAVWYDKIDHRSPNTDTCRWKCDYTEACLASRRGINERDMLEAALFHQDHTRH